MDTQKAIEYFSGKLERTLSNRRRQAYEIALEALEKQNTAKVAGHCKWCGQKIKREEEQDNAKDV